MPVEDEDRKYMRTACGLIGFIVFFMISFCAFIVADETGVYFNLTILGASVMLVLTFVCFAIVIKESGTIKSLEEMQEELLLEPQPALPLEPRQQPEGSRELEREPHWDDRTRHDTAYVRQVLGFNPIPESTSSEEGSDPDLLELRRMAKSGIPAASEDQVAGTSKESRGEGSIKCEGVADTQLDFAQAGPSRVDGRGSKATRSRLDIPLKDMSTLSLRGSSKRDADSEEKQVEVSAAFALLSLDSSENRFAKMSTQDIPFIDSEDKLNEQHSEHSETSIKSKDSKSSRLESKKET